MGVYKHKDRRGRERIYVDKRWPDGVRFKRVVPNRTIGKNLLSRVQESIAMGTWRKLRSQLVEDRESPLTLADLAVKYLAHCEAKNRRPEFKRLTLKSIVEILGSVRLEEFRRSDANHFIRQRSKQVKPATVNRGLAVLKHMMTFALEEGFLEHHPLNRFSLLPEPQKTLKVMTLEEERMLIDCVASYDVSIAGFCALLGETGFRKSEGLRLKWRDVDFQNRMVAAGETKNGEARYVPLSDYAIEWIRLQMRIVGEPHVFLRRCGKPWKDPRVPFDKGKEDAGLEWVGLHDFRHFRATQWVKHGVDLRTVKELLGHSTIETTMRYAHFAPNHALRAVAEVEKIENQELSNGTILVGQEEV